MRNINSSILKIFVMALFGLLITACVHDDKYTAPDTSTYQCQDLKSTMTLKQVKALYKSTAYVFPADSKDVIEGYVSSSDETGNIYKTIYIQDSPENPTEGFAITVDAVSTYMNFPQGSKIYVKLACLALGEYGGVIQLGKRLGTEAKPTDVTRIPEKEVPSYIFRSCSTPVKIVPKVMTLAELGTANDQYLGVLVKVKNAEFDQSVLCMQYAPDGTSSVDRKIVDPTKNVTTRVVRNSPYATFASKKLPSGNGDFVGILSKYGSTYQFYIVRDTDLNMVKFPRIDGIESAPCAADATAKNITVADAKALYKNSLTQITDNLNLTAKVTANDETGNLYKYFYIEDATGGIRVNINMTDLYLDRRFQVGRMVTINLKDLYIDNVNGELQIGGLYKNTQGQMVFGQIEPTLIYNHFFGTDTPISNVTATERTIPQLTTADIGKWVKIKDLQFINSDVHKTYADGLNKTQRTLEDCSGNKITLTTSGRADFGTKDYSMPANEIEIDPGKGDVYAIVSYYKGNYELWITKLRDIDLDNPRCDGTLPSKINTTTLLKDGFDDLKNWSAISVTGAEVWDTTTFGNPKPSAIMDGKRKANEDWLVLAKPVSLGGYTDGTVSFETDARYSGNAIEVYATDNFTGTPSTTTWTKLNPILDTDLNAFGGWVSSGSVSLKQFAGKNVTIAFKYTSVAGASTTWEIDNFVIKGIK